MAEMKNQDHLEEQVFTTNDLFVKLISLYRTHYKVCDHIKILIT